MTTGTANVPLHEQLLRFIENVRAHPGEIESNEHSITTPISWDGLGHAIHPLSMFEKMADALLSQQRSLDRVAALCDECDKRNVGLRSYLYTREIRAAIEAQPPLGDK